ncbi:MAG: YicC family protein [Hahellaceae bacterium]|nr:YicC family protein [Hahellaceae bacterium]MCP5168440.1 YicC family protein [Hahellaceae bacterium]
MLRSMTAFAREDAQGEWGNLSWEIRTVNHRYLEPHFRLPEQLRDLEAALRERIRQRIQRGKVECALRWHTNAAVTGLAVNLDLVQEISSVANQINRILDNPAHLSALEIMQWPGVLEAKEANTETLKADALALFEKALDAVLATREREGEQLKPLFEQRLTSILAIVNDVRALLPGILEAQRKNLLERFKDAEIDLDPGRLEQEMVSLAQKSDVAEELDRLETHVYEVQNVLQQKEPVGRRLDFLMQELNREANTLSSKAIVTDTTKAAVDLKVLIEQMREQVQNIE